MLIKARERMAGITSQASSWNEFMTKLNERKVILVPWCNQTKCEETIKERSGKESKQSALENETILTGQAKTLCVPL